VLRRSVENVGRGVLMAQLFQITHESSTTLTDATNYSGVIGSGQTIVAAAALAGTYGPATDITSTAARYCYKTQAAPASNIIRTGFRFRNRTLAMTDGDIFESCYVACSAAPWRVASLFVQRSGANIQTVVYARNDAGTYTIVGSYQTIGTTAHTIEIHIARASSAVANNGVVTWWLDGASIGSLTTVDNYDAFALINELEVGCVTGLDAGTSEIIDYDDVTQRDDTTVIFSTQSQAPRTMHMTRLRQ